jgi:hypothetical protein
VGRDTIPPEPSLEEDEYDEDLLDSLHLSPAGDADEVMEEDGEEEAFSLDSELPLEIVDVEDEPSPRRPARPGAETVASAPAEAENLRRRIARPLPELDLERIEEEEQEVEEISLEPPPSPAAPPAPAPTFRPYLDEDLEPSPPPPAVRVDPPSVRASVMSVAPVTASSSVDAVPVSVDLVAGPGHADVAIPVEIVLNNGTATVNLHVRLTLNLKLTQ